MSSTTDVLQYLKNNKLKLCTAESCTAGQILALLAKHEGCGECLEAGFVVYSPDAKKRILGVSPQTIEQYSLTSEEVAREMVIGALHLSKANIAIATTGLTGTEPKDGVEPGTICFAWAYQHDEQIILDSETIQLKGSRNQLQVIAAKYALKKLISFHKTYR